jgi:hypothetical protein
MKSLPGWKINIDETSNGVFKVTLTDAYGRKAEVHDAATVETIELAKSYAFDIEKQVSQNWNKFLYDLSIQEAENVKLINQDYNNQAFGSWFIEFENKRLVLDGKDFMLIMQSKIGAIWEDNATLKIKELSYTKYLSFIKDIIK